MNLYAFIAPLAAIALTAGFVCVSDAALPSKLVVAALLVLSFFIATPSWLGGVAGTLLQAALGIGILIYFKVAG